MKPLCKDLLILNVYKYYILIITQYTTLKTRQPKCKGMGQRLFDYFLVAETFDFVSPQFEPNNSGEC